MAATFGKTVPFECPICEGIVPMPIVTHSAGLTVVLVSIDTDDVCAHLREHANTRREPGSPDTLAG